MTFIPAPDENLLTALADISDNCVSGVERPPRDFFKQMARSSKLFVCQSEVTWGPVRPIYGYLLLNEKNGDPYIWSIAVPENYRGIGCGAGLIREAADYVKENSGSCLTLTVNVNNPAQKLYFNEGFRITAFARNYYGSENGLLMRREL